MAEREARRLLEVVHQSSRRRHHDVDQTERPPRTPPHQTLLLLRQALVTVRPAHAQLRTADVRVEHAVHLVRQVARRQHDQSAHLAANTRLQRLSTYKHTTRIRHCGGWQRTRAFSACQQLNTAVTRQ